MHNATLSPLLAREWGFLLVDTKNHPSPRVRAAIPRHLCINLMEEHHWGPMGSHFSGDRLFSTLALHWWWEGMHWDAVQFVKNCPECAIVRGGGRATIPPLHPIPVSRPFQSLRVDSMDLPLTQAANKHAVVFLTKWLFVFPVPDQRARRLAQLLVEKGFPVFGVPECMLSDRGANLLSHLMMEVCELLGIKKLNTTSYHSQYNGVVEHCNRTLKRMFRKHDGRFGLQWDHYLSGVMWAYRNTPIKVPERNCRSCCLEFIVGHSRKQHCGHPAHWSPASQRRTKLRF